MINHMMIVDDDLFQRRLSKRVAERSCRVQDISLFAMAQDALRALARALALPDLILLDLHMPAMNGFQFLDALNDNALAHCHDIPLYVLSMTPSAQEIARAKSHHLVRDVILKPLGVQDVVELADRHGTFTAARNLR